MKLYVMVDMEGISGIFSKAQIQTGAPFFMAGRQYLTQDVNACIAGCFEGGARQVTVRFAHGDAHQFVWEDLDPRAEYVAGATHERMPGLDGCAGLMLVGYHAMAGTRRALLCHTMSSLGWQNFWINGVRSGEIAIDAGIAGDHDVPTVLVTGDDKACREAKRFLPGVLTAVVKEGLNWEAARLLAAPVAHARIRTTAAQAAAACQRLKPYRVKRPVRLRLELCETRSAPEPKPGVRVVDGRTYEVSGPTVEAALNAL